MSRPSVNGGSVSASAGVSASAQAAKPETPPAPSPVAQLEWILKLPDAGGAWGKGIVATAKEIEAELVRLNAQKDQIDDAIKVRKKVQRSLVKRAEQESKMLFTDTAVQSARSPGQRSALADGNRQDSVATKP